ncbi:ATP-binding domain-containing protein, partial [Streptomyces sp. NPDC005877]|uniref:ATP-binding domain-containing protein n=1 Tax=Streptomyces sp. NPDC005877 TaxID=3155346 RepID=UPI0033EE0F93
LDTAGDDGVVGAEGDGAGDRSPRALHAALHAVLPDVPPGEPDLTRPVVLLDPRQAKGLEFDTVLVVEPARYGVSDLYVALTRATQRLGVLHSEPLPPALADALRPAAATPSPAAAG